MTKFTKEQLQEIAETDHVQCGDAAAMARQLLAGMEQEPVYFINKVVYADNYGDDVELKAYCSELDAMKSKADFGGTVIPLYAAPQLPQPAVPELLKEHLRLVECMLVDYRNGNSGHAKEWIRHISKSSDNFEEKHSLSPWLWARSAYRAAMLQGAEPVRQANKLRDGWVAVPVEPTAEMVKKMRYHCGGYDKNIKDGYKAMLAAAPQQEA